RARDGARRIVGMLRRRCIGSSAEGGRVMESKRTNTAARALSGILRGAAIVAAAFAILFAAGWFFAPDEVMQSAAGTAETQHSHGSGETQQSKPGSAVWTCSMHPQIRMPAPGRCPICGMSLVAAAAGDGGAGIRLS